MSNKFITIGNISLIKDNIIKFQKEKAKNPELPYWIEIWTNDSKDMHYVRFQTEEERDKIYNEFVKELEKD
jgi:hypothetical protein